ncbi:MAG: histidine triad nucleotide-binding protein [Clostridia bacterium]|nr:histidine triad nucleotide-binding protein [Clostridia bacterium]
MESCLFCKIAAGTIPAEKVYEDEEVLGFRDIDPQAPVHLLIIPKRHIESAQALQASDDALLGRLFAAARRMAAENGVAETGYRLVTNVGEAAGQSVKHLHLHLLGGRSMEWPPG